MFGNFRSKFVDYLANGIPVQISEEDRPVFYNELDKFINSSKNEFESFYSKSDDKLFISDKLVDYLSVSYEDARIIFRTTSQTGESSTRDKYVQKKMAEAFVGVVLFVESIAPSGDSNFIPEHLHDQWH